MDSGDIQQKTISLVVKTPNQAQEDQIIEGVDMKWTIGDLKAHLSRVYPSKPAISDQRLIFAGKLLPNHLHIKDLFRQIDSIPTLHLVCSVKNPPQAALKTKETEQPHPSSLSPPVQTPGTSELRQRRQTSSAAAAPTQTQAPTSPSGAPAWPNSTLAAASQLTPPAFPALSLYSPQQLLWLQHVYARQYYMQYHAAMAAAGSVPPTTMVTVGQYPPVPPHQVPVPAPLANQNPIDNLPVNQNPVQDGAFINAGEANQNMRMNAQGGPVMEDEEDMERDWLDWLYSAARLGVLLMIVYFNSNLSRFLLVMSTLLIMYLHTMGWFPFRRPAPVQAPDLQPPEVQHNQHNDIRDPEPNPADEPAEGQMENTAEESEEPMAAVLVPPHRVSIMWTAWVFFKTFFSSLIPEVPQGLAN
ncbi:PREDICTED: homocysteine-responsive endoplasmic reticulum-resident ubiquitin-like domain member 1 protein [Cyprinodon variegatus]|uniref:Homocysteine-inducible, endoplasmic reticulum stress-inducible, ubiquitin-like domain member 1 n=1 Tax=Cyprinodon variegatus TaxID=28743 RepID=A0A3Q2DM97_CYPVA|nr:PREDICTED: homocysteine-responsive endoplasmic reticulum-resident ubiquitin-like domain member 1 protein [Cyprinodon variegatus]